MDRVSESPPQEQATRPAPGERPLACAELLAGVRTELHQYAREHGYIARSHWAAVGARLTAHGVSQADRDELRAEFDRTAAEEQWVFPEELPPATATRRRAALVGKARRQASRVPLITEGYLSALLALGRAWDVAHDQLAQEVAEASIAERWPVDWELACGMEGLLAAEQARHRLANARQHARAEFERRGEKGWLSEADQVALYLGLRERGVSEPEARATLARLHALADARRWACLGACLATPPADARLRLLVDKVAHQVRRANRVGEGFRQALLGEADAAGIDRATLLDAIAERRTREQWSAGFSRGWQLARVGPPPWWHRVVLDVRRRAVSRRPAPALAQQVRLVAPSALRQAPLLVVVLATLAGGRAVAPSQPMANPLPAAPAPAVAAPIVPAATPAPTPVPVHLLLVAHTDGLGARLRTAPATGPVARLLGEGTAVVVIGTDVQVDGTAWKRVQAPDGTPGWMAADLLQPAEAEPGGPA